MRNLVNATFLRPKSSIKQEPSVTFILKQSLLQKSCPCLTQARAIPSTATVHALLPKPSLWCLCSQLCQYCHQDENHLLTLLLLHATFLLQKMNIIFIRKTSLVWANVQIRKLRKFAHYSADNQCVGICCTIYIQLQKWPLWVHCLCP